jgi:hypothetical protein
VSRSAAPLAPLAGRDRPLLVPAVSILYAAALAAALLAIDQLAEYMPGSWFEVLSAGVLVLCVLTVGLLLRAGWRRHRERLDRRGLLWLSGAIGAAVLGVVAVLGLVENAQIASVISGADVRLTKPVIESLPRPTDTTLLDEQPGLADTESISEDFTARDLGSIVPFYEAALSKDGWLEDKTSATTPIVRFTKGLFVLSVAIDEAAGGYTLTVDRVLTSPSAAPAASP